MVSLLMHWGKGGSRSQQQQQQQRNQDADHVCLLYRFVVNPMILCVTFFGVWQILIFRVTWGSQIFGSMITSMPLCLVGYGLLLSNIGLKGEPLNFTPEYEFNLRTRLFSKSDGNQ
jgi:hypothetical protein